MDKSLVAAQRYTENVRREIAIMQRLSHPNITSLLSVCENPKYYYLVLEYAAKGDLHTQLQALGSLTEPATRFVMAEVASALQHMHSRRIA